MPVSVVPFDPSKHVAIKSMVEELQRAISPHTDRSNYLDLTAVFEFMEQSEFEYFNCSNPDYRPELDNSKMLRAITLDQAGDLTHSLTLHYKKLKQAEEDRLADLSPEDRKIALSQKSAADEEAKREASVQAASDGVASTKAYLLERRQSVEKSIRASYASAELGARTERDRVISEADKVYDKAVNAAEIVHDRDMLNASNSYDKQLAEAVVSADRPGMVIVSRQVLIDMMDHQGVSGETVEVLKSILEF